MIFNVVFFIVLTSVLLQGTSLPLMAKWLGVDAPFAERPRYPLDFEPTGRMPSDLVEIAIPSGAAIGGKRILEVGLPQGALIVLLSRHEEFLVPNGGTVLEAGDTLLVLVDKGKLAEVRTLLEAVQPSTLHPD
jgi:cell volume regulation protein A